MSEQSDHSVARRRLIKVGLAGAGGVGAAVALAGPAAADMQATQVIDVKAHGAIGDGVTDDTTHIQAALNEVTPAPTHTPPQQANSAAPMNVVYFPPGDYLVSAPLKPKPNTLIVGTHTVTLDTRTDLRSQCKIRPSATFPAGSSVITFVPNSGDPMP